MSITFYLQNLKHKTAWQEFHLLVVLQLIFLLVIINTNFPIIKIYSIYTLVATLQENIMKILLQKRWKRSHGHHLGYRNSKGWSSTKPNENIIVQVGQFIYLNMQRTWDILLFNMGRANHLLIFIGNSVQKCLKVKVKNLSWQFNQILLSLI